MARSLYRQTTLGESRRQFFEQIPLAMFQAALALEVANKCSPTARGAASLARSLAQPGPRRERPAKRVCVLHAIFRTSISKSRPPLGGMPQAGKPPAP
jgi:hypothetical protein